MNQYKIESDRIDGMAQGSTVSASDFAEGTNIEALIEGGFITVVSKRAAEKTAPISEEK